MIKSCAKTELLTRSQSCLETTVLDQAPSARWPSNTVQKSENSVLRKFNPQKLYSDVNNPYKEYTAPIAMADNPPKTS